MLIIDFETRSRIDLKACGADVYAADPSTDIICIGYYDLASGVNGVCSGGPLSDEFLMLFNKEMETSDGRVAAHNARFDQAIWECIGVSEYGYPSIPIEQWYCTAAQCRVNALPTALDDAARAIDNKHRKDARGSRLISLLTKPQKDGAFNYDSQLLEEIGEYCLQDVVVTAHVVKNCRQMTPQEREDWQVNERINDRGVRVDVKLAALAQNYAGVEMKEIGEKLASVTRGDVTRHTQHKRLHEWLAPRLDDLKRIQKNNPKGELKYSTDKNIRAELLQSDTITDEVRAVIELADAGGKSSVSKFKRMLAMADSDDHRVRGVFVYAGAGQTQRYASRGLQMQNMRRDCWNAEETENLISLMEMDLDIASPVMDTLSKALRPAIIPAEGCKFVVGDWAAIEARVLPWLADSRGADRVLEIFDRGEDLYVQTATAMHIDDRFIGKVASLSLGFGGAVGAFTAMAKNYGLIMSEAEVKVIVKRWRDANQWAVKFWDELEGAAKRAVKNPGSVQKAGKVSYVFVPELIGGSLLAILPDDTVLTYPKTKLVQGEYGSELEAMKCSVKPKKDATSWPTMRLWGGFLAENATQATAAALLRGVLRDLQDEPVCLHIHDEVILEIPADQIDANKNMLQRVMERVPDWADGLPLKAVPEVFARYGK